MNYIDAGLIALANIILNFIFIRFSHIYNLLDYPNYRKKHIKPTPYTGGIVLSISYLIIVYITDYDDLENMILSFGFLISLAGFLDDKIHLDPGTKIILQFIIIILVVEKGLLLTNLGVYNSFPYISFGSLSEIFTIMCCLLIINSYNYNDGIDGVAISIFIIIFCAFYFYLKLLGINKLNSFIIFLLICNFISLIFNLSLFKFPKIFIGNSGSNLNGFIIAFFSIYLFTQQNINPALIIWPLSFLVFEFISINLNRILMKKKLFASGFDHIHYDLKSKLRLNNFKVLITISLINVYFCTIGWFVFKNLGADFSIFLFILHFFIYLIFKLKLTKYK